MSKTRPVPSRAFVTRPMSNEQKGRVGLQNAVAKSMAGGVIQQRHYPDSKTAKMTDAQKAKHSEAMKNYVENNFAKAWNRRFPVGSQEPSEAKVKAFLREFAAGYRPPWRT